MSSALRPGHARRFECLSAAWRPSGDGVFTASKPTVRPNPSSAHGMAATTDTSAATATLARSPWRTICMDRSSFTSDVTATMDMVNLMVSRSCHFKGSYKKYFGGMPKWLTDDFRLCYDYMNASGCDRILSAGLPKGRSLRSETNPSCRCGIYLRLLTNCKSVVSAIKMQAGAP